MRIIETIKGWFGIKSADKSVPVISVEPYNFYIDRRGGIFWLHPSSSRITDRNLKIVPDYLHTQAWDLWYADRDLPLTDSRSPLGKWHCTERKTWK